MTSRNTTNETSLEEAISRPTLTIPLYYRSISRKARKCERQVSNLNGVFKSEGWLANDLHGFHDRLERKGQGALNQIN